MEKLPYLICMINHPFRHSSAGIRVCYNITKDIRKFGYESYVVTNAKCNFPHINLKKDEDRKKMRKMIINNAIAIYPEAYNTNYLWSKNPIGWYLNKWKDFNFDGLFFTFQKEFKEDAEELRNLDGYIEPFFNDKETLFNKINRKFNCIYVGKGKVEKGINVANPVIINYVYPAKRKALAKLLRNSIALYTYDNNTALNEEARLCGCPVVNLAPDLFTNWKRLGMVHSIDDIEKAKSEIKEYQKEYYADVAKCEGLIINFIKKSQEWAIGRTVHL